MSQSFSRRLGPVRVDPPITIREDAPSEIRHAVLAIAESYDVSFPRLLVRIARRFRETLGNVNINRLGVARTKVWTKMSNCSWNNFLDIVEEIHKELASTGHLSTREDKAADFSFEVNDYFREKGVGYQLVDGKLEHRGDDVFEQAAREALKATEESGLDAAHRELSEAMEDLSKRPTADLTGAITHSMNVLESVARIATDDQSATLGKILNDNTELFPKPLDVAVEKMWGYASQYGRHVSEGKEPTQDEAELVVHVSAAAVTYLVRKAGLIEGTQTS